jgi:hypothetical protein
LEEMRALKKSGMPFQESLRTSRMADSGQIPIPRWRGGLEFDLDKRKGNRSNQSNHDLNLADAYS